MYIASIIILIVNNNLDKTMALMTAIVVYLTANKPLYKDCGY